MNMSEAAAVLVHKMVSPYVAAGCSLSIKPNNNSAAWRVTMHRRREVQHKLGSLYAYWPAVLAVFDDQMSVQRRDPGGVLLVFDYDDPGAFDAIVAVFRDYADGSHT